MAPWYPACLQGDQAGLNLGNLKLRFMGHRQEPRVRAEQRLEMEGSRGRAKKKKKKKWKVQPGPGPKTTMGTHLGKPATPGEAATLVLWGAGRCVSLAMEGKKYLSRAQGHSAWDAWPHLQWPVCKTTLSLSFPGAGWVAGSPELRRLDDLDLLGAHPTETGAPDGHKQGSSEGAIVV